ncbi:MAG TPA: NADP-dependent phosphogluconate dehydrogenase [Bacteroidia bacterium]|jgi:6-phosphogluconate dehydrogenase|nr:NADP-dependent phosphogluconate dehydrogenase [Bacteroidia bacterium]
MAEQKYDYGVIGLGTMGRNLVLNMTDHGYRVAGFDKDTAQVKMLQTEAPGPNVFSTSLLAEFIESIKKPRVIILLVPAGKVVDEVIDELKPLLSENDLVMDCGNSHFTDTDMRSLQLKQSAIHFMGVGISGGETGARFGPSIMPGGPENVYARVAGMLEAISAKVENKPCVTWLGPGSAGHYVKMVHNGIEYGIMQLIAESYHLLKIAGGLSNDELHALYSKWNTGILHSFLLEITADIFSQKDELTDNRLIDVIRDRAHQKGTGGWTSEDAIHLQVPIPTIDAAVSMRDLSAGREDPAGSGRMLQALEMNFKGDKKELIVWLEQALYFSMITTYAQGMALLQAASKEYKYNLKPEKIAEIWRGGCIIRASLLEDIRSAFSRQPDLPNLLTDPGLADKLMQNQTGIRKVIQTGVETGIPIPAMMGSLAYYDSLRSAWLPANLIQAQRDYFGAHTYERNDRQGIFHTHWNQH